MVVLFQTMICNPRIGNYVLPVRHEKVGANVSIPLNHLIGFRFLCKTEPTRENPS